MYKPGLKIHPRCMAQKAHLFHLAAPHGTRCCVCSSASKTMPRALKSLGFLARKKKNREKHPRAGPPHLHYFISILILHVYECYLIDLKLPAWLQQWQQLSLSIDISGDQHDIISYYLSLSLSPPIAISTGETDLGDQHVSPIYSTVSIIVMWGHNS